MCLRTGLLFQHAWVGAVTKFSDSVHKNSSKPLPNESVWRFFLSAGEGYSSVRQQQQQLSFNTSIVTVLN